MDNISTIQLTSFFSGASLGVFFIKSFSIVFAFLFTLYAIVTYKQVQEMARTVTNPRNRVIVLITFSQIIIGIFLLAFAILFV